MFDIFTITFSGEKTVTSVMSRDLLGIYVRKFLQCKDVEGVLICDGLTGEVLLEL